MPRPSGATSRKSAISSAGSPKRCSAALVLQHQELPLDRAHRRGGDIAVLRRELGGVVRHIAQQRAQVLEVEQQQALLVGDPEQDVHARPPGCR